jgi:hypothetical protein
VCLLRAPAAVQAEDGATSSDNKRARRSAAVDGDGDAVMAGYGGGAQAGAGGMEENEFVSG